VLLQKNKKKQQKTRLDLHPNSLLKLRLWSLACLEVEVGALSTNEILV
jgi:hypothetical protein